MSQPGGEVEAAILFNVGTSDPDIIDFYFDNLRRSYFYDFEKPVTMSVSDLLVEHTDPILAAI